MRRQSMVEYGRPLCETVVETPQPTGTEVLLRIRHCGVCHSDLHLHGGHFDLGGGRHLDVRADRTLPFTLGHEIEGEVEAIGPAAEGVAVGDHRAVFYGIGCGACPACAAGDEHLCTAPRHLGINVDGGFATHVLLPHPRYLLDYSGIHPALAGSLMCSGLTAFSALKRLGSLGTRGPVLLVGMGGVGMAALAFARALLPHAPVVVDVSAEKRVTALATGAAAAIDPGSPDLRGELKRAVGGGVFAAIDFVGSEATLNLAQRALRRGGKVVVVGLMGGQFTLPIPFFPMRAMAIEGSYLGSLAEAREMLDVIREKGVAPMPVETRPLAAVNEAMARLRAGRVVGRMVLQP